jgi:hypothetical protein
VEDEGVQGGEKKGADGLEVGLLDEGDPGRGDGDHRGHVQGEQRLGMGVVAEHGVAEEAVGGVGDLLGCVGDDVQVDIGPLEVQTVRAVGRIGVGHRDPTEAGPAFGGQRLGVDGPGDVGHGSDPPCSP